MKNRRLYLFVLLLLFAGNISSAQNSIFEGKITDENNKPIPGARIKILHTGDEVDEVQSDKDGLYYTQLLPWGHYNINVRANGKYLKGRKVYLQELDDVKHYYNLKMAGDKVEITVTETSPFTAAAFDKLENRKDNYMDFGNGRTFLIRSDAATGKMTEYAVPEAPGKMVIK